MSVSPEKEKALAAKMKAAGLREADIDEKFIRSGGKGGQNVNKTSTCVYLKHRPSGLEVKIQQDRSQHLNRFLARRVLLEKFEQYQRTAERYQVPNAGMVPGTLRNGGTPKGMPPSKSASELKREKIRKQKKRRARRSGTGL